ncbi:MAG: inositol monophosphatase family protein [Candidatus Gastranaerophilaceae bacterium]|jgi:myo-inositol-1(or 4)-monophosphatase
MSDILKFLEVAKAASLEAGKIHMEFFDKTKDISYKCNKFDLVTNVDKSSEKIIESIIMENFPEHAILGEEEGIKGDKSSEYLWIVDPLDGTTNYTHNFPHFAVSIGMYHYGKPCIGVIYDSFKKEMFYAAKGEGAYLNYPVIESEAKQSTKDKKIMVTEVAKIENALLATGFPYSREGIMEENLAYFKEFLYQAQAVRRPGSASLDLAYVACGRLDGFWELNLSPWDVAAGVCIIEEAGGKVSNIASETFDYNTKNIIASNAAIHKQIEEIILQVRKSF